MRQASYRGAPRRPGSGSARDDPVRLEDALDPAYAMAQPHAVSLWLLSGHSLNGSIRFNRPPGQDRLSDWSDTADRFCYIETEEGALLLEHARGIIEQVGRARHALNAIKESPLGKVVIATPAVTGKAMTTGIITTFAGGGLASPNEGDGGPASLGL